MSAGLNVTMAGLEIPRPASVTSGLGRLVMVFAIIAAFLNPILRFSPDDPVTLFRILLPIVLFILVVRTYSHPATAQLVVVLSVFMGYSLLQLIFRQSLRDSFMQSYLVNELIAIAFVYLVVQYANLYGGQRLYKLLYLWFALIILFSIVQLTTGLVFPNAPFRSGVARIYFGQENDASAAICAFVPLLFSGAGRRLFSLALLAGALYVLYVNGTRTVLIAVAAYPFLIAQFRLLNCIKAAHGIPRRVALPLQLVLAAALVLLVKDVDIQFSDHASTLDEMVLTPIGELLTGVDVSAEVTSINVRITLVAAGFKAWIATAGFGLGPGGTHDVVAQYYPSDFVQSVHSFPLQILFEQGWLLVVFLILFTVRSATAIDWTRFGPFMLYLLLATSSGTSGLITNYYLFASVVMALFAFAAPSVASLRRKVGASH